MTDELKQWEYDRGYAKGQADALDKVRAEIESIRPCFWNSDNELIPKSGEGIVDIIDKHKAESEE